MRRFLQTHDITEVAATYASKVAISILEKSISLVGRVRDSNAYAKQVESRTKKK
jgi:hypothetical protein